MDMRETSLWRLCSLLKLRFMKSATNINEPIYGVLLVMFYLLDKISSNRCNELKNQLTDEILSQENAVINPILSFILTVLSIMCSLAAECEA